MLILLIVVTCRQSPFSDSSTSVANSYLRLISRKSLSNMYRSSLLITFAVCVLGAQAQVELCEPGVEYAPHPDCTKYYQCNNGNPILQDCPEGLYWNPRVNICDFPTNVEECVDGTRPPIGTTTPTTEASTTTTAVPTEESTTQDTTTTQETTTWTTHEPSTTEEPTTTSTAPPSSTTEETPVTEPTESTGSTTLAPGVCPPEGVHKIAHEENCNMYYLCINGERQPVSTCPDELLFNPAIGECDMAENVDCGDQPTTPTTAEPEPSTTGNPMPECPDSGVHKFPYPGNCTLYIMCIESAEAIYRCPDGQLFDTEELICKPAESAVCTVEPSHIALQPELFHVQNLKLARTRPFIFHAKKVEVQNYSGLSAWFRRHFYLARV